MTMATLSTSKLSSKGQVVIPEDIRNRLGLQPGDRFVVAGEGDTIVFKVLSMPAMDRFSDLIAQAQKVARQVGLTPADISDAIRLARKS